MFKYVLLYETQTQIESEWGTSEEVICFESDKSLNDLKYDIKSIIANNDKKTSNIQNFCQLVLASDYNHYIMVYKFINLYTLEDWFQLNKRIP
jgi:hypothetical protein